MSDVDKALVTGFLYGIESDLLISTGKGGEVKHRVEGFRNTGGYREAKQALLTHALKLIEDSMPKKKREKTKNELSSLSYAHLHGYNKALQDTEQQLIKAFEEAYKGE